MNEGQAQVLNRDCIVCGGCLRNCPQKAKQYASSIYRTENLLKNFGRKTAVSIAPSFAADFDAWQQKRLPGALRMLGFDYVFETAAAAYYAALESLKYIKRADKNFIHSSCPAVINYITKYKPELAGSIAPVVSPMIAHAKIIKDSVGADTDIVFVGPCVAKKDEALWDSYKGLIAEVLTFKELEQMLKTKGIDLKKCEESAFDKPSFYKAQYYPLPGGILKTLDADGENQPKKILCFDGEAGVKNALDNFESQNCDVELMWCAGGCLNGPAGLEDNLIKKRANILDYAQSNKTGYKPDTLPQNINLSNNFTPAPTQAAEHTEKEIENTLKAMGKEKEEDRLNCQSCGYPGCREKAIAILNGYAQKEMCMPYLRKHLLTQNAGIIDSMPGGVALLDSNLNIVQTNAYFNKMFNCAKGAAGSHISVLMDPHPFEKVLSGEVKEINWIHEFTAYNLKCRFIVYDIKDNEQLVGVFIPILNEEELSKIKSSIKMQAVDKARELLKHQIETSQKVAKYLGESTAESQDIVNQIMQITSDGDGD
jgi:iron only hydrogenase large subunit-like protein